MPMILELRVCKCGKPIQLNGVTRCNSCLAKDTAEKRSQTLLAKADQQRAFATNWILDHPAEFHAVCSRNGRLARYGMSEEKRAEVLAGRAEKKRNRDTEWAAYQQQKADAKIAEKERKRAETLARRLAKKQQKAEYIRKQKEDYERSLSVDGEEWRDMPDYSRYQVSSMGRFRNKKTGRHIAHRVSEYTGYYAMVGMHKDSKGKQHTLLAHRMVAQVFIPNPDNKQIVNHINHVRHDSRASNLEWVDMSENAKASKSYYDTNRTMGT